MLEKMKEWNRKFPRSSININVVLSKGEQAYSSNAQLFLDGFADQDEFEEDDSIY